MYSLKYAPGNRMYFGSIMSWGSFNDGRVVVLSIVVVSFFILHVAFKLLELLVLGMVGVLVVHLTGGGLGLDGDNLLDVIVVLDHGGGGGWTTGYHRSLLGM